MSPFWAGLFGIPQKPNKRQQDGKRQQATAGTSTRSTGEAVAVLSSPGKEQVEMFINAIEESAKNRPVRTPVAARQIKGEEELRKFMKEWEKANADQ